MSRTSKQHSRQVASPSPTPGDLLSTLLLVKDTINTTLLNEHTRCAELSTVISDIEEQLRDTLEHTIKSLKTETEKRKKKIYPGIKKLQDCLKSLHKSEARCKASERGCKNADSKKAKRRIKEAQKILQEVSSSDVEVGLSLFVSDQINILCQRLLAIPPKVTFLPAAPTPTLDKSDSDSEGGFASRTNTPNSNIYAEIDLHRSCVSPYLLPRNSTCLSPSEGKRTTKQDKPEQERTEQVTRTSTEQRLSGVLLFSSDSEGEQNSRAVDSHRKNPQNTREHVSRKNVYEHKACHKLLPNSPFYDIIDKPSKNDIFRYSTDEKNRCLRRITDNDYETPLKTEHPSLSAPIAEYLRRMSPSLEKEQTKLEVISRGDINKKNELSPPSARGTPKRLLPAVPKQTDAGRNPTYSTYSDIKYGRHTDGETDILALNGEESASLPATYNTVELLQEAKEFLRVQSFTQENDNIHEQDDKRKPLYTFTQKESELQTKGSKSDPDYVDIEEVEFRESISSTRQQILDKLKSKCSNSAHKKLELQKEYAVESNPTSDVSHEYSSYPTSDVSHEYSSYPTSDVSREYSHVSTASRDGPKTNHKANEKINELSNLLMSPKHESVHNKSAKTQTKQTTLVTNYNSDTGPRRDGPGVFKSKLIHISASKTNEGSSQEEPVSIVTSAIQKFEKASMAHPPNQSQKIKPKFRSSSEPRQPVSSLHETYSARTFRNFKRPDISKSSPVKTNRYNSALQPRNLQYNTESSNSLQESFNGNGSLNGSFNGLFNMNRSCTENDLRNLVSTESSSSIRRQWSKRRSSSLTPKTTEKKEKPGPLYKHWTFFHIPEKTTRSFISAIVVLDDSSIVVLDERHGILHLFDKSFKYKDQCRLLDVPRNCVKLKANEVAVALPYKRCITTYAIELGATCILSNGDIRVPCSEWIVDIAVFKDNFYVLCKGGDLHVLSLEGHEVRRSSLGLSGRLFIHPSGKRLFVIAENRVSRFDISGMLLSTKPDVDAYSMIILENRIYVLDRTKHKLLPLTESADVLSLTDERIEFPSAISSSISGDLLFISQYEESMDIKLTRRIQVLKLKSLRH